MTLKDDRFYLIHIKNAIESILEYTLQGKKEFLEDKKTQDAVIRNFQVIGEATKKLSSQFTKKYAKIPWKKMAGLRDKIVHEYFGIDLELLWQIVSTELKKVYRSINTIEKSIKRN